MRLQQRGRLNNQELNNDSFHKQPVSLSKCPTGTEKCRDAGINIVYREGKLCQCYDQVITCFKQSTRDCILQPCITQ